MKKQILIINKDIQVCYEIQRALENETTQVIITSDLDEAIRLFVHHDFCLIVMDAALSETDGYHYLRIMRKAKPIFILILSSNTEYPDRLQAFQSGANAYLGKPYNLDECIAQAKSLINLYVDLKPIGQSHYILSFGKNLIIDPLKRQVIVNDRTVDLTRKEFDLLFCLASHPGRVLSRTQLYSQIWDTDTAFDVDEIVKSHIKTLRKKLADSDTGYIKNVWGVGYRFDVEKTSK